MNFRLVPVKVALAGAALVSSSSFSVLLFSGYSDPSLYGIAAGTALGTGLLLLLFYYQLQFVRKILDDLMNHRGGGPKGPHPLPADDSHILNQRRKAA